MNEVTNFVKDKRYLIEFHGEFEVAKWDGTYFVSEYRIFPTPDKVYALPKHKTVTLREITPKKSNTYIVIESGTIFFGKWDGEHFYNTMGVKVKRKVNQIVFGIPKYGDIK